MPRSKDKTPSILKPVGYVNAESVQQFDAARRLYKISKESVKPLKRSDKVEFEDITGSLDFRALLEPFMNNYSNYRTKDQAINHFSFSRDTSSDVDISNLDDEEYIESCKNQTILVKYRKYMSEKGGIVPSCLVRFSSADSVVDLTTDRDDDDDDDNNSDVGSGDSVGSRCDDDNDIIGYPSTAQSMSPRKRSKSNDGASVTRLSKNVIKIELAGGRNEKYLKGIAWRNEEHPSEGIPYL